MADVQGTGSKKPEMDDVSGFKTPFQDALLQKIPTSGEPTGSKLPKP